MAESGGSTTQTLGTVAAAGAASALVELIEHAADNGAAKAPLRLGGEWLGAADAAGLLHLFHAPPVRAETTAP